MFELIEMDTETGEELLCSGSWAKMVAARDEITGQADDEGQDWPSLMIQRVS